MPVRARRTKRVATTLAALAAFITGLFGFANVPSSGWVYAAIAVAGYLATYLLFRLAASSW